MVKKVILKKNPSKKSFFEYFKIIFHSIFKERVFITLRKGKLTYYHISATLQFIIVLTIGCGIYWSVYTSKFYFLNSEMLKQKDKQIQDARNKFNKTVVDIKAYRDTIENINKKIETSQQNVIHLLEKNQVLTKLEKDNLIKNQLLLSTELKYVNSSLNDFTKGISWASVDVKNPIYKTTKNELEKNVVLNENIFLKERNDKLENSLNDMRDLQNNLVDKITVLAEDEKAVVNLENITVVNEKKGYISGNISFEVEEQKYNLALTADENSQTVSTDIINFDNKHDKNKQMINFTLIESQTLGLITSFPGYYRLVK